jgi:hypothetical protein
VTRQDELRAMRERKFAKSAKISRGSTEGRAMVVTATLSKKDIPAKAEAGIKPSPREAKKKEPKYVCPVCEARRLAKRASMAKWRAKKNG